MSLISLKIEQIKKAFLQDPFHQPDVLFDKDIGIATEVTLDGDSVKVAFKNLKWEDQIDNPYGILKTFKEGLEFPRDFLVLLNDNALLYYLPLFLSAIVVDANEADVMIDSLDNKFKSNTLLNRLSTKQRAIYQEVMGPYKF